MKQIALSILIILLLVSPVSAQEPTRVMVVDPLPKTLQMAVQPLATTASPVICDGDGTSGYRVQVLYVRGVSTPSRYNEYLNSFKQWAYEADSDFARSPSGARHIRFVTDASCYPIVIEATVSDIAATIYEIMSDELRAQHYTATSRIYMVFMDSHDYCGVSSIADDDKPTQDNLNNIGPAFDRIDNGCWGDRIPAHELAHNLGAVQMTAPHSDGTHHCTDGYDNLCDHGGKNLILTACPDPAMDALLDCNGDDYYNTNPSAGNYLSTHWNIANSQFLMRPIPTAVVIKSFTAKYESGNPPWDFLMGIFGR